MNLFDVFAKSLAYEAGKAASTPAEKCYGLLAVWDAVEKANGAKLLTLEEYHGLVSIVRPHLQGGIELEAGVLVAPHPVYLEELMYLYFNENSNGELSPVQTVQAIRTIQRIAMVMHLSGHLLQEDKEQADKLAGELVEELQVTSDHD